MSDAGAAVAEIETEPQPVASAEPPSAESPDAIDAILNEAAGELSAVSVPEQAETQAGTQAQATVEAQAQAEARAEAPAAPSAASAAEPKQAPLAAAEPTVSVRETPGSGDHVGVGPNPPDKLEDVIKGQDLANLPNLDPPSDGSPAEPEPAGATPSVDGAGSAVDGSVAQQPAPGLGEIVLNAPMVILAVLDKPFANLSIGTKNVLGYIGLATLVVAMGTWLAGFFIRPA